jgi:hypothetical protein
MLAFGSSASAQCIERYVVCVVLCVGGDLILYHLVLFQVLWVPCACFPSLQFILFAIRAPVDCNGARCMDLAVVKGMNLL